MVDVTDNVITIVRGTTPSLIVDFSDITDFAVADITSVALTIMSRTGKEEFGLSDMTVADDTLSYHWTQEQTLSYAYRDVLRLDMHVVANGERYKVYGIPEWIRVENTGKNEVM